MEMKPHFWKGKRVFLTGHTGFKGSWLSLWLQRLEAEITGYSLPPPTKPNLFELANVEKEMTSIIADIRDIEMLQDSMKKAQPEIVIHMAAQSLVRTSYKDPVETYAINVMGTVHCLEAIRHLSCVKAALVVTSDKCYANKEWIWPYREDELLGGYDPYSNSKGCAELVTAAYRTSFFNQKDYKKHGVAIATARAGNVIGGGDWSEDRLIPDILRAFKNNHKVHIRNPNAIRPWQYVLEPLRGYLMLIEKLYTEGPSYAEAWNFGPAEEGIKKVSSIVEALSILWKNAPHYTCDSTKNPYEANYLRIDSSKANLKLGWNQLVSLPETLQNIVDWYHLLSAKADMHHETLKQIEDYEKTIKSRENIECTS